MRLRNFRGEQLKQSLDLQSFYNCFIMGETQCTFYFLPCEVACKSFSLSEVNYFVLFLQEIEVQTKEWQRDGSVTHGSLIRNNQMAMFPFANEMLWGVSLLIFRFFSILVNNELTRIFIFLCSVVYVKDKSHIHYRWLLIKCLLLIFNRT